MITNNYTDNGWYSEIELLELGFNNFGKNILISKKSSIFGHKNISLGSNIRIDDFVIFSSRKKITIGNNVHIGAFSYFAGNEEIEIQDNVGISQSVRVYSTVDDFFGIGLAGPMIDEKYRRTTSGKVKLEKYSIIGSGSVIFPGVTIGFNSAVGAMSLVNKDISENKLAIGIPAKETLNRSKIGYKKYEEDKK
jgi:acetyltransferase-like isoleucine patch superfamily enzyme